MNVVCIIQDNESGSIFDISELVTEAIWDTFLENQPGKLSLTYTDDGRATIHEGSSLSFTVDGRGVFFGYVITRSQTKDETRKIIAYDQMFYLQNKDTYVFSDITASGVFEKICLDYKLKYKVVSASNYILPQRLHDGKSLFEIIKYGIYSALSGEGRWFIMRDNFGTLEFRDILTLKTFLYLGAGTPLTDFSYESSIGSDTFNRVKLVRENKKTVKREIYQIEDSSTIGKWGILQYFETVSDTMNEAQIKERAEQILRLKNRITKTVGLDHLGDLQAVAGSGIILGVEGLDESLFNKYFMITKSSHTFKNDMHTMKLELQVSI